MLLFLLLAGLTAYFWSLINVLPTEHLPHSVDKPNILISGHSRTMNPNQARDLSPDPQMDISDLLDDEDFKPRLKCKQFTYELPQYSVEFFGRQESMDEIVSKLVTNSVNLMNINGPLGCGKSLLAVQLGHRLLKEGLSVSYIDVSDRRFDQFTDDLVDPQKENLPKLPPVSYIDYPIANKNYTSVHDVVLTKELSNWSETLMCSTVLILDNCNYIRDNISFVQFLRSLIISSNQRLKIVVTSRNHLDSSLLSWTVSELNMDSSMKLLRVVAPLVDKHHLDKLLALLGGCPLVLKIAGNLLERSRDHMETILTQIESRSLNRVRSQHQQFLELVHVVYEFLPPSLRVCGQYLHLFPGSFDKLSGERIMDDLNCIESIDEYVERSLLDEYFISYQTRLKMPSLVWDYFKERSNQSKANNQQKSVVDKNEFKMAFSINYIDMFVLETMNPFQLRSPDEYNLQFSMESHNIHFMTTIIFTHRLPNSVMFPKEMAVLVPLSLQGWIPFHKILDHYELYKQLIAEMKPVCKLLPGSRCINFYSQLVSDIYHSECNPAEYNFTKMMHTIYHGNKKCGALFMDGTRISYLRVWNRVGLSIQSFIYTARWLVYNRYAVWAIQVLGLIFILMAFCIEYIIVHKRRSWCEQIQYLYLVIVLPAAIFAVGILLIFWTGNCDLAVILHFYLPSTVFILALMLFSCYESIHCQVLSYIFRLWFIILFVTAVLKLIFWLYSALTVPLTNVIFGK